MKESSDLLCNSCHRGVWAQRGVAVTTERNKINFLYGAQQLQCLKCGREYLLVLKGSDWVLIPGRGSHVVEAVIERGKEEQARQTAADKDNDDFVKDTLKMFEDKKAVVLPDTTDNRK